ncbi:MAG: class I SAM-dependent methyltransferase [Chlamydiae bacterium]|nr:class I SAM-dependent methyltransferase [Chlamydiota bacterium]
MAYSLKYGISPMPSSKKCCKAICSLADGKVAELGCGFGGLALKLQKKGLQVDAFEISPIPYFIAKLRGVSVQRKNFFEEELSQYDTIVCYLYPGAMEKLAKVLKNKRIITNTFALPGRKETKVLVVDDIYRTKIISYDASHE